jgi:hypothetical protein
LLASVVCSAQQLRVVHRVAFYGFEPTEVGARSGKGWLRMLPKPSCSLRLFALRARRCIGEPRLS